MLKKELVITIQVVKDLNTLMAFVWNFLAVVVVAVD
jgi:hypothetical protein